MKSCILNNKFQCLTHPVDNFATNTVVQGCVYFMYWVIIYLKRRKMTYFCI